MKTTLFHINFEPDFLNNKISSIGLIEKDLIVHHFDKCDLIDYMPDKYKSNLSELLMIPTVFDINNCANYDGVEFAMQWYFHLSKSNQDYAIVLLGIEEKSAFFLHCDYSYFLKCPNVYYIRYNIEDIKCFINNYRPNVINKEELIRSIKRIGLKPPTSYKSHHSITNEWCIYRWSKSLGVENEPLSKLELEMRNSLYFNYLKTINPIGQIETKKNEINSSGKILLVDDEVDKGWDLFFQAITKKQDFKSIGSEFKKQQISDIIESTINKIKSFDPDLVILDLRLHDDDFDAKKPSDLTGVKILKEIKKHNKGIQVLMFTASDKIWNYLELENIGLDGFIIKESPSMSYNNKGSIESINNLINGISRCLDIKFAKSFYDVFLRLKGELEPRKNKNHDSLLPKKFVDEYLKWLEFGIVNILTSKSPEKLVVSFLMFFSVLENVANRIIDSENPEVEENINNEKSYYFTKLSQALLPCFH